ncbi:hypothetical protein KIN20_022768 [Parelaphostrongylus tenuis]|uniref:Uncharacterized protein n=1 Tax=Parelaphostrongylus tenuis TaxID=148309 RepID=A0AAD5N9E4_PARTN|nr:hypothetical protein KIN20_022768 [Parelaphostrongylus tenuis]
MWTILLPSIVWAVYERSLTKSHVPYTFVRRVIWNVGKRLRSEISGANEGCQDAVLQQCKWLRNFNQHMAKLADIEGAAIQSSIRKKDCAAGEATQITLQCSF